VARRWPTSSRVTRTTPEKSADASAAQDGRPQQPGRINHPATQGGGHKRAYRVIDFRRYDQDGVPAKVVTSSTTPTAPRASRCCTTRRREALHRRAEGLTQGTPVESGPNADIKPGNNLPLRNIPVGTTIHCVELRPGGGAKIARSAGISAQLVAKEGSRATLRMPSGEMRFVDVRCRATVGEVGNAEQSNINWGKAGRMRWKASARRCVVSS
jgi:large subunit ribosomal protein L2